MAGNVIRAMIVDDEPVARAALRALLEREPDVEIVAEAADVPEAVRGIVDVRPDLVFLDIELPSGSGFDVLTSLAGIDPPRVIFVTAYSQYAVRAFDIRAFDYILKPYSHRRVARAVEDYRAGMARSAAVLPGEGDSVPEPVPGVVRSNGGREERYWSRIRVESRNRFLFLPVARILWFEAARNYVDIHAEQGRFLIRSTMRELTAGLDPMMFVRVHRGAIVNVRYVREVVPLGTGDFQILLESGDRLRLSRTFRAELFEAMRYGAAV